MPPLELNTGSQSIHEQIEQIRDEANVAADPVARRYATGDHDQVTTPEQQEALGLRGSRLQQDNVIGQAVGEIAGRLMLRRFVTGEQPDESSGPAEDALATFLGSFFVKNQLARKTTSWAAQVLIDGTTAAIVVWDNERKRPVVRNEPWWDGEAGMFGDIAPDGDPEWACREWHDGQRLRRTLYLPGLTLRYQQAGGGWQQIDEVVATRGEGGKLLGVPVVVFTNELRPYQPYGRSDVQPVIGNQDALNGTLFDLNAASMLTGMQLYYATGVDNTEELLIGPGRLLSSRNETARFGAIQAGNIEQLIELKHEQMATIAAQFPVPTYRLGAGEIPAGIALQRADGPMIAKVRALGDLFAPSEVLLSHRAVELANVYDRAGLDEDILVGVEWAPPDQVDPGTQMEIDREKANLYAVIEELTPTMIKKLRMLNDTEIVNLLKERAERMAVIGDFGSADEDEDRGAA